MVTQQPPAVAALVVAAVVMVVERRGRLKKGRQCRDRRDQVGFQAQRLCVPKRSA